MSTATASQVGLLVSETEELGQCGAPEYNPDAPNANTIIFIEDWRRGELPDRRVRADAGLAQRPHRRDLRRRHAAQRDDRSVRRSATARVPTARSTCRTWSRTKPGTSSASVTARCAARRCPRARRSARPASATWPTTIATGCARSTATCPSRAAATSDYTPNHGFSPLCAPDDERGSAMAAAAWQACARSRVPRAARGARRVRALLGLLRAWRAASARLRRASRSRARAPSATIK